MKKWLRLGVVLALCASAGWAVDWKALPDRKATSATSPASSIRPAKSQLEAYCTAVEQATGAQMALVTIPSLEGEPIEDVANTIFRAWGVGQKGKNEGILLLLAIDDRRSRLEVGYGLEPILPDGLDGSILREMRPALRQRRLRRRHDGRRADHRQHHRAGQARAHSGAPCHAAPAALPPIPFPGP